MHVTFDEERFEINVKAMDASISAIFVKPTDTVESVKEQIQALKGESIAASHLTPFIWEMPYMGDKHFLILCHDPLPLYTRESRVVDQH